MNRIATLSRHLPTNKVSNRKFSTKNTTATKSNGQQFREVVIVATSRTPVGSFGGSLASMTAPQLGSVVIKSLLEKVKLDPKHVDEVQMGEVISAGVGQAPTRQAALGAGLPNGVITTTVNKVCASGMKAIMNGAQSIMLGQNDVVIAGGMESMSNIPYYMDKLRNGARLGHAQVYDGILKDGLTDAYHNFHMGNCAEDCAKKYNITREQQDNYAIESYKRAQKAVAEGVFKDEITPVTVTVNKQNTVVSEDEEPSKAKLDKMPSLKPAFDKNGTVTAANSSKLNDGASAVLLMSAEKAKELGLKPLARVIGFADAAQAPIEFTTAPALAVPKMFEKWGINKDSVDFYEINEAFSVVSIANNQLLKLDPSKVNVYGGAVSMGHAIGNSGSRIVVTLLNVLQRKNGKIGVAAICNGGGEASALAIERLD
eukprot:TRINITY_DN15263_c0_g1_i1.p1 TRINITY_DN15263_c0_g1~~TRINITY_DN15263_c0_g1_i1.p1  ORF type:complete len:428 (-),score=154.85 TRINITY_DN15263_c0_g1_i1:44-1327(-)